MLQRLSLPKFLDAISVSGATSNTFEQVVDAGYDTLDKILGLKVDVLAEITTSGGNRIGFDRAAKILNSLSSPRIQTLLVKSDKWLDTTVIMAPDFVPADVNLKIDVAGLNVCLTGTGPDDRDSLKAKLKAAGATVQTAVTSNTHLLISSEGMNKGKAQKASALGVRVLPYDEVF